MVVATSDRSPVGVDRLTLRPVRPVGSPARRDSSRPASVEPRPARGLDAQITGSGAFLAESNTVGSHLMRVTRPGQVFLAATALAVAGLAASPATASSSDNGAESTADGAAAQRPAPPTWAEFKRSTYRDTDGQFIVNGDEPVDSVAKLHKYYDKMMAKPDQNGGATSLVVNQNGGVDDVWSQGQVGDLTYCVSTAFGGDYGTVVNAMQAGAALWEGASSAVDFVYDSAQDGNCNTGNGSVVFSVEPTFTNQYIARSFFPSSSKSERNILVVAGALTTSGWAPGNILGHEMGHILGFRHEHTRPEAGTCFEDNNWRPLTPYDSASIMHYPQCNGTGDLTFSGWDGDGTRAIYGS
jgi:hypothetical protein